MSTGKRKKTNRRAAQAANQTRRVRRRRGRHTLHYLILFLFVSAAGIILSLTVFFPIDSVVVTGSDRYDPQVLAAATGIEEGENLLRIRKDEIRAALLTEFPYIESVEIRRSPPSTVKIEVTQSIAAGVILQEESEYVLITREGKILERGLFLIPDNVPVIKGIDAGSLPPGATLGDWEKEAAGADETPEAKEARLERDKQSQAFAEEQLDRLRMLNYLFEALEVTGFGEITNVDVSNKVNMKIMYENRLLLELGTEGELAYKLQFIQMSLPTLYERAHGTIYAADAALNVQVRYKPAPGYDTYGYPLDMPPEQRQSLTEEAAPENPIIEGEEDIGGQEEEE